MDSNVDVLDRNTVEQRLTQIIIDEPMVQAYITNLLRTTKFEEDFIPDDGSSLVGEMWSAEYSAELQRLVRDIAANLINEQ